MPPVYTSISSTRWTPALKHDNADSVWTLPYTGAVSRIRAFRAPLVDLGRPGSGTLADQCHSVQTVPIGVVTFSLQVRSVCRSERQSAGAATALVQAKATRGTQINGLVQDLESLAIRNDDFRRVLYTAQHCQLVVMALKPKEEIGAEVHKLDQFFRVEDGAGEIILDGVRTSIRADFAIVVPAAANHNIITAGSIPLRLYTSYAPPHHRDGVVHHTRADGEADTEHFDGRTSE
jgi:mannose-6-phosphate isomerase-like protein (cupin superfamily)